MKWRCDWKLLLFLFLGIAFVPETGQSADDKSSAAKTSKVTTVQNPVDNSDPVANSVVKVFSKIRVPDPYRPWTKDSPREYTGTGVVIKGKRILSNAHVVLYASEIQVLANQSGDKLRATVEFVAPGIDLAVLKLEDESFFETHPALSFSETLPHIKDAVTAYGYPEGGNSLSLTRGIVSRIEFADYNLPVKGLRIQIDAAINPGNSGGPAMAGDKMIGLAFSHLAQAQNIGYIIPTEEIELFLNDVRDGHYDGKPAMYEALQTLENPALRKFLKIDKSVQGMVVREPFSNSRSYPLKAWDVLSKIGDVPIDDRGLITVDGNLRLKFEYLVQRIATNGSVPMTVWRNSNELKVQVPVAATYPFVLFDLGGRYPSYFIYGPMSFSAATKQYVEPLTDGDSGRSYAPMLMWIGSPLISRRTDKVAFEGEELVVVTAPLFPHKLATGYSEPYSHVIKAINSVPIKNLKHLVEVLRDSSDEFITVEFQERFAETCVFNRREMVDSTEEILSDNGVRSQGSDDVMAVWNLKSEKRASAH
jgi:S1-C subfamily serine protease